MIDTQKALRKAYYDTLNGFLVSGSDPVPVYDGKLEEVADNYVILSTQTATDSSTIGQFGTEATILIDIVAKSKVRISKNNLDEIAQQVLTRVLPAQGSNGLVPQPFLQIMLVKKESDQYFDIQRTATGFINRRLIRFSQFIHET
jgi:hypothetical protein